VALRERVPKRVEAARTSENSVPAKFSIAPARRMKRPGRGERRGVL
jgi:hypothetical protein